MFKLGQYSFRRILLSRLLLLSVPVLLIGVYVTYRKARTALLETARQNLTESAVNKGQSIQHSVKSLHSNLITASNNIILQAGSPREHQGFLRQLSNQFPATVECLQLINLQTQEITASTCGGQAFGTLDSNLWQQYNEQLLIAPEEVQIKQLLPTDPLFATPKYDNSKTSSQLKLILLAPVYDLGGRLRYALWLKTALVQQERTRPGSLFGYPVIMDEDETILVHPFPQRVGRKIEQEADAAKLRSVIRNAIAGDQNSLHLFSLEKNGVELLAGYTSIPSPITSQPDKKWIILAVTRLDDALADLKEIRRALLGLTFALIIASFLATLYISRELAYPLEELRDYALNEDNLHSAVNLPQNLRIREFNQLAAALNSMVRRLKAWAEELEAAWKEGQAANQVKNEFLATISHELRTPLNGIIGSIQLIQDGYCDNQQEEMELLQQAHQASIHLLGIINDVLDIAKIEQGKLSLSIEKVNLCQILNEVVSLQAVAIQEKGLQLKTSTCQEEIIVYTDPLKLKQVLINIVGNAVKFTESGSITISNRLEVTTPVSLPKTGNTKTNRRVVVTVKDTGIGIEPAQQNKLFRPFVMVDGSTTRRFGGTGLGLAISRNLMELMGGTITLSSPGIGKGTIVEISIPVAQVIALSLG